MTHHSHEHTAAHHGHHMTDNVNVLAVSATLHCLTGCAIGEIAGLIVGTALGLSTFPTTVIAIGLAFVLGYTLSTLPLVKSGLGFRKALTVVLAADTLSILTMEIVDNLVMIVIPGAMAAGLVNSTFWVSMLIALTAAFAVAYPVNRYLLQQGKGHALTHEYHHGNTAAIGWRRYVPTFSTGALVTGILAFILGGLIVSTASTLEAQHASGERGQSSAQTVYVKHPGSY